MPNELVWVMEKLGFEWPDVAEFSALDFGGED